MYIGRCSYLGRYTYVVLFEETKTRLFRRDKDHPTDAAVAPARSQPPRLPRDRIAVPTWTNHQGVSVATTTTLNIHDPGIVSKDPIKVSRYITLEYIRLFATLEQQPIIASHHQYTHVSNIPELLHSETQQ